MNLGLGNLFTIKSALLPDPMQADTQFDALISSIARGVAASFDQQTNRSLMRMVSATDEFDCNRSYCTLSRYPVECIQAVDFRYTVADDWESEPITDVILNRADIAGILDFNKIVGPNISRMRITYTGGYWFETLEPTDQGFPSTMPTGATALPGDLADAWLEQCQFIFTERDTLGQKAIKKAGKESVGDFRFAEIGIVQRVQDVLATYRRFTT